MDIQTKIIVFLVTLILAVAGAFGYGQYRANEATRRAQLELTSKLDRQKVEASNLLIAEQEKAAKAQQALTELINKAEVDRETQQIKNRADLHARIAGLGLRYGAKPGRGASSGDAKGTPDPGTCDPGSTVVQLPEPLAGNLQQLAADAESLAIDYGVLYRYVNNPDLVCELRPKSSFSLSK